MGTDALADLHEEKMPASSNAMPRLPASTSIQPPPTGHLALNSRLDDEDALWSYLSDDSNHDDLLLATVSPNLLAPNRDSLNPLSVTPDQLRSQLLDLAAYDLNSSSTSRTYGPSAVSEVACTILELRYHACAPHCRSTSTANMWYLPDECLNTVAPSEDTPGDMLEGRVPYAG